METTVMQQVMPEWHAVPLWHPLYCFPFYDTTVGAENGGLSEWHNVDKNMHAQDLSLMPVKVVIQA